MRRGQRRYGLEELEKWADTELDSAEKAARAAKLVVAYAEDPTRFPASNQLSSPFRKVVAIFQQPTVQEAKDTLRAEALPALLRSYDAQLLAWSPPAGTDEGAPYDPVADDLLFSLKILAQYRGEPTIRRIVEAARRPIAPEDFLWSVVLSTLVGYDPEAAATVARALREPLPPGFLRVAFLDMANTLAREHRLTPHPFDTEEGRAALRGYLSDRDPDNASYAHSATASLPFLADARELLALAEAHPSTTVQMEAAWAAARGGDPGALERLRFWSRSPRTRKRALAYLDELGVRTTVPRQTLRRWARHPAT